MTKACCVPDSGRESRATAGRVGNGAPSTTLVDVPGGSFVMGDESPWSYPGDGEGPTHKVELTAFAIDRFAVTNDQFATFVDATGHVTDAERYGWSFVFAGFLPDDFPETRAVVGGGVVASGVRVGLVSSDRAAFGPRRARRPSGGARVVGRCAGVLRVDRNASPHRSRMGMCRPWRITRTVPVGRRARAGWRAPHERLPGTVPGSERLRRRLRRDSARRCVPSQFDRPAQRHRQRVGVVCGLVRPRCTTRRARAEIRWVPTSAPTA